MKFLTFTYWTTSGSLVPVAQKGLLALLGIFIIALIILKFVKMNHKRSLYHKLITKIEAFFWGNLIIGTFLWFFTYQGLRILSARLWFLIWFIIILIWIYFIIKVMKQIPELREKLEKEKEFKKYIP